MQKQLIYDTPTRIFHGLFSVLFVSAFLIAKTIDDENPFFSYHMLAGLMLGTLVFLRILWGFIGTPYARFSSFALRPTDLVSYVQGIFSGNKKRWAGHNPASSWAALIMMGSAVLLAISGVLMTTGYKKTFEDAHEFLANIFLVTVLLHVAGVIIHSLRHQDGIALSMLNGKKEVTGITPKLVTKKPLVAVMLVLLMSLFALHLMENYDSSKSELKLVGKTLLLGENEKEKSHHHKKDH